MAGRGYAKVQLIGNLGKDPEARFSQSGTETTRFSLAVNRNDRQADGSFQDITDWYNCTAFGSQGKVVQDYLKKGSKVFIEGRLQIRQYDDKDGMRRTSVDVTVSDVQLIDSRQPNVAEESDSTEPTPTRPTAQRPVLTARRPNQPANYAEDADDLPF